MMSRKKKTTSAGTGAVINAESDSRILSNLKAKNSEENLSPQIAHDAEIQVEKMRKRSLGSLPTGESEEEEDEYMFIRLKKHIKGHWDKIMERYPNGKLFFKPAITTPTIEPPPDEVSRSDSVRTHQTDSSATSTTLFDHNLLSSAIKSVMLLPAFSLKKDDEGRRPVPFISSILQVHDIVFTKCNY